MGRRLLMISGLRTAGTFLLGFAIGAIFNLLLSDSFQLATFPSQPTLNSQWGADVQDVMPETLRSEEVEEEGKERQKLASSPPSSPSSSSHHGDQVETYPRVLCFILVGPRTHRKGVHVKNTWGQRCDQLVFYSTEDDPSLKPEVLDIPEGYGYLWAKTKASLAHLYRHYPHFHWYLKADDDTYVIVENLRYFLQDLDPDSPVHYGVKFRKFVKQGYMSGGGGYVLSREALKRFVTEALDIRDQERCDTESDSGSEDLQLGQCLESIGVAAGDSLDEKGLSRFFSHSPLTLFFKQPVINRVHWYWRYIWHPHSVGPDCCSQHVISFHDIEPRMMWVLETLLYRLRIHRDLQPPDRNTSTSTPPPPSPPPTSTSTKTQTTVTTTAATSH